MIIIRVMIITMLMCGYAYANCSPGDLVGNWDLDTEWSPGNSVCSGRILTGGHYSFSCTSMDNSGTQWSISEFYPLAISSSCTIGGEMYINLPDQTINAPVFGTLDRGHTVFRIFSHYPIPNTEGFFDMKALGLKK